MKLLKASALLSIYVRFISLAWLLCLIGILILATLNAVQKPAGISVLFLAVTIEISYFIGN